MRRGIVTLYYITPGTVHKDLIFAWAKQLSVSNPDIQLYAIVPNMNVVLPSNVKPLQGPPQPYEHKYQYLIPYLCRNLLDELYYIDIDIAVLKELQWDYEHEVMLHGRVVESFDKHDAIKRSVTAEEFKRVYGLNLHDSAACIDLFMYYVRPKKLAMNIFAYAEKLYDEAGLVISYAAKEERNAVPLKQLWRDSESYMMITLAHIAGVSKETGVRLFDIVCSDSDTPTVKTIGIHYASRLHSKELMLHEYS